MKNEENYHHGDLRTALLKAAHQRLSNNGYESFSLRELARDAGVAVSAPYFHFKNRDYLFAALIQDGANDQKRRFSRAAALPCSNQDRLVSAAMNPRDTRIAELTAVACWSLMHGYAMLTLHKRLGSRRSAVKKITPP